MISTILALGCLAVQDGSRSIQPAEHLFLAESPWPIFHANTYAQGVSHLPGPSPQDKLTVQFAPTQGPSSWILLGPKYGDGSRPLWGGTMNSIYKAVVGRENMRVVHELPLKGKSITDGFVLRDGTFVTLHRKERSILFIKDERPGDPNSKLKITRKFALSSSTPGELSHMTLSYDGWILWLTDENYLGAVPVNGGQPIAFKLPTDRGEVASHNSFPIDEQGNMFIVSSFHMFSVNFRSGRFQMRWSEKYDFAGTNFRSFGKRLEKARVATGRGKTGSGTTPTLIGRPGEGRLVGVVDGREPNNFVLFWADQPRGSRVAGVLKLPYSTPQGKGYSAENSPVGWDNKFVVAQWNGFRPGKDRLPGVQRVDWDGTKLKLGWSNANVSMNGVPTLSVPSNLVYSSGPDEKGVFQLVGLDWNTGRTRLQLPLGRDRKFMDQGNQIIVLEDRSLVYSGAEGLVRICINN